MSSLDYFSIRRADHDCDSIIAIIHRAGRTANTTIIHTAGRTRPKVKWQADRGSLEFRLQPH